ncbi:MAG: AAA family ATPase, partial [Anaerolineaceae bacterium]|nr:AAA family ATPase [Anaerolineaceae bacterium]
MNDLFDHAMGERMQQEAPLAARMRPRTFDDFIGQEHIIGEGKLLRRAIQADRLFSSIIFTGPPGTGKTTLAQLIALHTKAQFETISAVLAGVAELRRVIHEAEERRKLYQQRTILFIDEVHRWNKAQQDALLPHVESGMLTLIGATTENPYFDVIPALVSRSRVFQLQPLEEEHLLKIIDRALFDPDYGYGKHSVILDDDARNHLIQMCGGDARNLLNALELAIETTTPDQTKTIHITLDVAQESIQKRAILYDKSGDVHYDTISAFIKSVRGSDPDAALYWLAKMMAAGEDPRFILR